MLSLLIYVKSTRLMLLPHVGELKWVAFSALLIMVVCFCMTIRSGRALAKARRCADALLDCGILLIGKDADVLSKLFNAHRRWRIALDWTPFVAVLLIELILIVKGVHTHSILKDVHLAFVFAFLVSFVGAHICNGNSARWGHLHKHFTYSSMTFFIPVTVLGLYLFWQL